MDLTNFKVPKTASISVTTGTPQFVTGPQFIIGQHEKTLASRCFNPKRLPRAIRKDLSTFRTHQGFHFAAKKPALAPPAHVNLEGNLNATLQRKLECPVCYATCLPPIFMCVNGHNACGKCAPLLDACAVCRHPGRPILRNLFAEEMSIEVMLPCRNNDEGCSRLFNMAEMKTHLPACEKQFNYRCRLPAIRPPDSNSQCSWIGRRKDLLIHVEENHPYYYLFRSNVVEVSVKCLNWLNDVDCRLMEQRLVHVYDSLFWCCVKHSLGDVVCHVTHVGGRGASARFTCKIRAGSSHDCGVEYCGNTLALNDVLYLTGGKGGLLYVHNDVVQQIVNDGVFKCRFEVIDK